MPIVKAKYMFFFDIIIINFKGAVLQGIIIKALAGFYYVESDGQVYQTRVMWEFP